MRTRAASVALLALTVVILGCGRSEYGGFTADGNEVDPDNRLAVPIHREDPVEELAYQAVANASLTLVVCRATATINPDGSVADVQFGGPSEVVPAAQEAILAALRDWRFEPATRNGRPVAGSYTAYFGGCPLERPPLSGRP